MTETLSTSPLVGRSYLKMNGAGNAIVVLDLRGSRHVVTPEEARDIARLEPYDQMMVLHDPVLDGTEARVKIYNNDGSLSGACGNGTRCLAWYLMDGTDKTALTLQSDAGLLICRKLDDWRFSVDMGLPRFEWNQIPLAEPFADTRHIELQIGPIDAPILHSPAVVNMGNPHAVFWVDDAYSFQLDKVGPLLENHPIFPQRANISLAQVNAPDDVTLRVWERGAGITLACGSAACAVVAAGVRDKRLSHDVNVHLPGGDLTISQADNGHIIMSGPVELEHRGRFDASVFGG
jgi:diaminopimelate epimerase